MTDLKVDELKIAEEYLIKSNQTRRISQSTNYLNLTIDENGLIRWTGRLSLAPLTYETRLPILLDPYRLLTKLIILNIRGTNL